MLTAIEANQQTTKVRVDLDKQVSMILDTLSRYILIAIKHGRYGMNFCGAECGDFIVEQEVIAKLVQLGYKVKPFKMLATNGRKIYRVSW